MGQCVTPLISSRLSTARRKRLWGPSPVLLLATGGPLLVRCPHPARSTPGPVGVRGAVEAG